LAAKKGNNYASVNKGKKHKATKLKAKLDGTLTQKEYNDIIDFKNDLIKVANELFDEASNWQQKKAVFDSVAKYVFFEKHEEKPKENKIIVTLEGVGS